VFFSNFGDEMTWRKVLRYGEVLVTRSTWTVMGGAR